MCTAALGMTSRKHLAEVEVANAMLPGRDETTDDETRSLH